MIYDEFDFSSFSKGKNKEENGFDCMKFYSENLLDVKEYVKLAKDYFVTGDFDDSTDEEKEEDYEEITNVKEDQVIEKL